jgi:outer membrane protein
VRQRRLVWAMAGGLSAALLLVSPASAATLVEVLAWAYSSNPQLNAQRADLRATDEGVPQAKSGYRPSIFANGQVAAERIDNEITGSDTRYPRSVNLQIEQPIFLGFRTKNSVRAAESSVLAGREVLRSTEQDVLLDAVTAFMDVAQNQAIVSLRSQNLEFLREQVRAANDRLNVGEGTRTDVAQTNASLSQGLSDYAAAVATLAASNATYQMVIGRPPDTIGAVKNVDKMLPRSLDAAIALGRVNHPSITAANFNIDVASFNVKVIEGEFLPRVTVTGEVAHSDNDTAAGWTNSASIVGQVSVPIYQAGEPDARARQAKETLGQLRIQHDLARDTVRQSVVAAWSQLDAARSQIRAADQQVSAQQLVLSGIIEERNVGQRTTLDVLDSQQDLINARISQVTARRNSVVAAYTVLSSIGALSAAKLGLAVAIYDPKEHHRLVRDKWGGLRTPDGR